MDKTKDLVGFKLMLGRDLSTELGPCNKKFRTPNIPGWHHLGMGTTAYPDQLTSGASFQSSPVSYVPRD